MVDETTPKSVVESVTLNRDSTECTADKYGSVKSTATDDETQQKSSKTSTGEKCTCCDLKVDLNTNCHFECTKLPPYQLYMLHSTRRLYTCQKCVSIPKGFYELSWHENCKVQMLRHKHCPVILKQMTFVFKPI